MNPNGKNTHINTNTNMKNTAKKYTNYNDNDNDNDNNDCNLSIAEPAKRNTKLIFDNIELDVRQVKQILENMKKLEF